MKTNSYYIKDAHGDDDSNPSEAVCLFIYPMLGEFIYK